MFEVSPVGRAIRNPQVFAGFSTPQPVFAALKWPVMAAIDGSRMKLQSNWQNGSDPQPFADGEQTFF